MTASAQGHSLLLASENAYLIMRLKIKFSKKSTPRGIIRGLDLMPEFVWRIYDNVRARFFFFLELERERKSALIRMYCELIGACDCGKGRFARWFGCGG